MENGGTGPSARGSRFVPGSTPAVLLVSLILLAVTVAVYAPLAHNGFSSLDVGRYITENPHVRAGLTPQGLVWAFTSFGYASNWHPLTWLSHMLDVQLFGLAPRGHNLMNLLLHVANTLLLFRLLRAMTGFLWRSGLVALLFAIHPLHVESVAWVAERKDVLSTFFWILALGCYLKYVEESKAGRYLAVLAAFALGLLAKPMLVTLPFTLLLLDFWPLGRLRITGEKASLSLQGAVVLEKIPLFVLSGASSVATYLAQKKGGAMALGETIGFWAGMGNACISPVRYLYKAVWPLGLAVYYPYAQWRWWQGVGAALFLAGLTIAVITGIRKHPYFTMGWLWFLGTLVPVLGIVQVGSQSMADRYSYIPLVGIFVMIAYAPAARLDGLRVVWKRAFCAATLALAGGLMVLAHAQAGYWKDDITLFSHALAVTEDNWKVHNFLGSAYYKAGRLEDAIVNFQAALRLKPGYIDAMNNLGIALNAQGKVDEAIAEYREALRLEPDFALAQNNLGTALLEQGKHEEALGLLARALPLMSDNADAHYNYANALEVAGRLDEAADHFSRALGLDPGLAEAYLNLGVVRRRQGRVEEALASYAAALRVKPASVEAHFNSGLVLERVGRTEEASGHYREALRIDPAFEPARIRLEGIAKKTGGGPNRE